MLLAFSRLKHSPRGALSSLYTPKETGQYGKNTRGIRIVKKISDLPTRYNAKNNTEIATTATANTKLSLPPPPLPPLSRTGKPSKYTM